MNVTHERGRLMKKVKGGGKAGTGWSLRGRLWPKNGTPFVLGESSRGGGRGVSVWSRFSSPNAPSEISPEQEGRKKPSR